MMTGSSSSSASTCTAFCNARELRSNSATNGRESLLRVQPELSLLHESSRIGRHRTHGRLRRALPLSQFTVQKTQVAVQSLQVRQWRGVQVARLSLLVERSDVAPNQRQILLQRRRRGASVGAPDDVLDEGLVFVGTLRNGGNRDRRRLGRSGRAGLRLGRSEQESAPARRVPPASPAAAAPPSIVGDLESDRPGTDATRGAVRGH
jgi:hypothetical protein